MMLPIGGNVGSRNFPRQQVPQRDPVEGSNDVLDYNFVFTHLNPGKPKEHQGAKDNGQNQGSAQKHSRDAIGGKDAGQSQRHGNDDGYREVSRGLSNENLHVTSVAVNEKGLCLNDL